MVRQGWAEPSGAAEAAMEDAKNAARQERIGLWRAAD
jgi:endonuclease YncB( thermonuclease family)